jgi:diguanylate cyclase (GGDEF)-like protein
MVVSSAGGVDRRVCSGTLTQRRAGVKTSPRGPYGILNLFRAVSAPRHSMACVFPGQGRMAQAFIRSGIGRLVLALMLLAIAPAMLLLWHIAGEARDEHLRAAAARQQQAAGFGVTLFEELLATVGQALALEGEGEMGWAGQPGACIWHMRRLAERLPFIAGTALVARDGRVLCTNEAAGGGVSLADRRYLAEARQPDRLAIGAPETSRVTGRTVLPIARRIAASEGVEADEVPAAIVAALDLARLAAVISTGAGTDGIERPTVILDGDGRLLARWPRLAPVPPTDHPLVRIALSAPAGAAETEGLDGKARVVGFAHARSAGLAIAVTVERSAVTGAAERQFALALALMALAGAAGIGVAAALARTLVGRPLLALAAAAEAVREGAALPALPPRPMVGELETLKRAFARMAGEIRAREAALAEANAELAAMNTGLAELAERDALTGLANRRAFDAALAAAWSRARREASPVGLLILDLDHFRQFNDRYGHLEGDACLVRVAAALAALKLRPHDLLARLGGEEFAVLLPDDDVPGAIAVAERIRAALHRMMLLHEGSPHGIVTASIGAASIVPIGPIDPRVLLAAADRALYAAKAGGRDRVSAAGYAAAA